MNNIPLIFSTIFWYVWLISCRISALEDVGNSYWCLGEELPYPKSTCNCFCQHNIKAHSGNNILKHEFQVIYISLAEHLHLEIFWFNLYTKMNIINSWINNCVIFLYNSLSSMALQKKSILVCWTSIKMQFTGDFRPISMAGRWDDANEFNRYLVMSFL